MSTHFREVCLEVYVDGVFYCGDSCRVPEEEDAQVEFRITDAIYDLFGSSAVISAQLEVDSHEGMSVSYSVLEGDPVQVDFDMNDSTSACVERDEQLENKVKHVFSVLVSPTEVAGSSSGIDASPETPENSPTESTKVWMMKKIRGFFLMLVAVPEPLIPQPTSEADLVDTEPSSVPGGMNASSETPEKISPKESTKVRKMKQIWPFFQKLFRIDPAVPEPLCVPDASVPEPEPELDLVDPKESCVPVPSVSEPEPELDLVDSDELCVPGPSVPYACTSEQELVQEETCFSLEERVKGCTQHQKPVTVVWNNIFIGNEEIARDRMTLKELGITHILNAAAVEKKLRVMLGVPWETDLSETVNTGARYYRGMNITYCGLPTTHSSNISEYFLPAARFIRNARKNPGNKVFIHCTEGVSYAPTLFLAYLMIHHYMIVEEAIDYLIQVRYIKPDIDFLKQLAILNEELVHNTATKYRRENNSWINKKADKILQKKCCRAQIKKCARIKRKYTRFRYRTY